MVVREAWLRCACVALLASLAACGSKAGTGKPDAANDHSSSAGASGAAGTAGAAGTSGAAGGGAAGAAAGGGGAPSDGGAGAAAGAPADGGVDSPGDVAPDRAMDAPTDTPTGADKPPEAGAELGAGDGGLDAPIEKPPCVPMCAGKECGGDGCGGSCTACPTGKHCTALFMCTADVVNDCGPASGLDPLAPWPTGGRCPARRSVVSVRSAQKPVVTWTYAGGSACDPAIARDGTMYVFTAPSSTARNLQALKPDGTPSWSLPDLYSMQTPSIGPDGTLYFGSNKFVYAITSAGTIAWKAPIAGEDWPSVALGSDGTVWASGDYNHDLLAFTSSGAPKFTKPGIGNAYPPAVAADGTLYFVSPKGVTALKPDGTQKWQSPIGGDLYSSPAIASDGTIYVAFSLSVAGGGGGLRALDPATGAELWTAGFGASALQTPTVAGDGTIYVSLGVSIAALDAQGRAKWQFPVGDTIGGPPTVGGDGTIYFTSQDENVYALNPDGTLKWNMPTRSYGSPVIGADGTLYVRGLPGLMALGCANGNCGACVPVCDGRQCGPDGCGGSCGACGADERCNRLTRTCQPTAPPGGFGVCGDMRGLQAGAPWPQSARCPARSARAAVDGPHVKPSVQWTYAATNYIRSPVIAADGTIYLACSDKNLHAVTAAGQPKWKFAAGSPVGATPVIGADGTIYTGSADPAGKVFAVNPDGTKRWSLRFPFRVSGSGTIGGDGTIYFETAGYVFADRLSAFDPLTGAMVFAPQAGFQDGVAIGPDGTLFVNGAGIQAFRPDGKKRWATAIPGSVFATVSSSPPLASSGGDTYGTSDLTLAALKPDGTVRWSFSGKLEVPPTIAADGSILQADSTGYPEYKMIRAFKPEDGTVRWSVSSLGVANGGTVRSPLLVDASGWIYYVAVDKSLYALNATGDVQWSLPIGTDVTEPMAMGADGTLYLSGSDFKLYAVRP
jgi:outer membrane protein assembly factor BamB